MMNKESRGSEEAAGVLTQTDGEKEKREVDLRPVRGPLHDGRVSCKVKNNKEEENYPALHTYGEGSHFDHSVQILILFLNDVDPLRHVPFQRLSPPSTGAVAYADARR